MTTKQLSHEEMFALLKSSKVAQTRPDLARMILTGMTRFESAGVTYALEGSLAAGEMLDKDGPELVTREAPESVPAPHPAPVYTRAAPVVAPAPPVSEPETKSGSDALLSIVSRRSSMTDDERADDDANQFIKGLFDGPEAA